MAAASVLGIILSAASPAQAGPVADIVAKMPAYDAATGQPMLDEILKLGPGALKELCSLVTPPQDTGDAKARYAVHGLVLYAKRPGADAERAMVEKALMDALKAAQDPDLKVFFIEQLQLCGSDACVSEIAPLLSNDRLCDPAARCLTRIGTPACVEAVRAKLPNDPKGADVIPQEELISIVQALGVMKDKQSAKAILLYAADPNTTVRRTVWYALANIGDVSAVDTLNAAAACEGKYERALGARYLLLLARRIAENGDKDAAAAICRELIRTRTDPAEGNVQCAAMYVLQKAVGEAAADDLLAALDGKNVYVRQAAIAILERTGGGALTTKLIDRARAAFGEGRAELIALLGRRGDKSAAPVVLAAMDEKDPAVAAAAIKAAASLAPDNILKLMTERMKSADPAIVAAARQVLAGIKADGFEQALVAAMADASPAGKAALLDLLASRGTRGNSKVAFDALTDADGAVRDAAARALASLAGPADIDRLLTLMLTTDDERLSTAAQGVVVAICRRDNDPGALLDALAKAGPKHKPVLCASLARLGGPAGLQAVMKEMDSSDPAVKDAATRALTEWQTAEAIEPLVKLAARNTSEVHRVLAIRGIVRLLGRGEGIEPGRALAACRDALAAAKTPAEKNLLLGAVGNLRTVEALTLAAQSLDDPDIREAAAAAIIKIASPDRRYKGLKGPAVTEAMNKIIAVSRNPAAVKQAKNHLESGAKGK